MRRSVFVLTGIVALASGVALLAPSQASDEKPAAVVQVEQRATELAPKGWNDPKTPAGQPDLEGYYTNVSLTPMTRPKDWGDQLFDTPKKADSAVNTDSATCLVNCKDQDTRAGDAAIDLARAYNDAFFEHGSGIAVTGQTSLIVDPPDGRMPPLTEMAKQDTAKEAAELKEKCADPTRVCPPGYDGKTPSLADKPADFSLMSRCITWGTIGPPMTPSIYDSNYLIVQTPKYVMIQVEGGRGVRTIPVDGSPHVPPQIHLWQGDSRGHWEGNTLVVDTTNFNDEDGPVGSRKSLHIVERFTKVAPHVLLYEFTVNDPYKYTRPYTGIIPMTTIKGPIFEYACNEGNYALADILRGARLDEKKRAETQQHEGGAQ